MNGFNDDFNTKFRKITICVDMAGCPNRCRHCWIGAGKNGHMTVMQFENIANMFRGFSDDLEVISWYREPDYRDDYRDLWNLECRLSTVPREHFELVSFWRLVRDDTYADWLYSIGVRRCQLTLFGGEEVTDYYIGRKGAYKEIISAIQILLDKKISIRLQVFVNKSNISELEELEKTIKELHLEEKCAEINQQFQLFIHQGSCDGENKKLYDIRVTKEDLYKIPKYFVDNTMKYMGVNSLSEVFGETESSLYIRLSDSDIKRNIVNDTPVFYIDNNLNVYPNETSTYEWWKLGNLKQHSPTEILYNYINNVSSAQNTLTTKTFGELVSVCGVKDSERMFTEDDYLNYIINKYYEPLDL